MDAADAATVLDVSGTLTVLLEESDGEVGRPQVLQIPVERGVWRGPSLSRPFMARVRSLELDTGGSVDVSPGLFTDRDLPVDLRRVMSSEFVLTAVDALTGRSVPQVTVWKRPAPGGVPALVGDSRSWERYKRRPYSENRDELVVTDGSIPVRLERLGSGQAYLVDAAGFRPTVVTQPAPDSSDVVVELARSGALVVDATELSGPVSVAVIYPRVREQSHDHSEAGVLVEFQQSPGTTSEELELRPGEYSVAVVRPGEAEPELHSVHIAAGEVFRLVPGSAAGADSVARVIGEVVLHWDERERPQVVLRGDATAGIAVRVQTHRSAAEGDDQVWIMEPAGLNPGACTATVLPHGVTFPLELEAGDNVLTLAIPQSMDRRLWFYDSATDEPVPNVRFMFSVVAPSTGAWVGLADSPRAVLAPAGLVEVRAASGDLQYVALAEGYGAVEGVVELLPDLEDYHLMLDPLSFVELEVLQRGVPLLPPSEWIAALSTTDARGRPVEIVSRSVENPPPTSTVGGSGTTNVMRSAASAGPPLVVLGLPLEVDTVELRGAALEGVGGFEPVSIELRPGDRTRVVLELK